jgi:hypothetical protein
MMGTWFSDGCPAEWARLPIPEGRIVAGLSGGHVRDRDERKASFGLIAGRSTLDDRESPASAWCMVMTASRSAGCSDR